MTELVHYDAMCRAIDAAYQVDEVKDIRDKALAIEQYSRQARNTEAERRACEIRVRAEGKCGAILAEMEEAKGAAEPGTNRGLTRSRDETASPKTLADYGLTKSQSHRFQQLAAVPEEQFEVALAAPAKPSTAGIIARAEVQAAPAPTPQPPRPAPAPAPRPEPMDERALWLWGRLRLARHCDA